MRITAPENPNAELWARYEGTQAKALGIQLLAEHGAQGRGVLVDLHHHYGRERHAVTYDALMRILDAAVRLADAWGPVERGPEFLWHDLSDTTYGPATIQRAR